MKVWKPKVWLYEHKHTTELGGRGRMSREHKAIIEAALLADPELRIEGYSVERPAGKGDNLSPAAVKRTAVDPNRIVDVPDMRRDESMWTASVEVDGKRKVIGFRTVDNGCGSSLGWCYCETSRVWVDADREAVVVFSPKKN